MEFLNVFLASNYSLVSLGTVALAVTMLTATLGTLAYKANRGPVAKD